MKGIFNKKEKILIILFLMFHFCLSAKIDVKNMEPAFGGQT